MSKLECPNCGEVFSKKDVRRHFRKWGHTECQNCGAELGPEHFEDWHPLMNGESDGKEIELSRKELGHIGMALEEYKEVVEADGYDEGAEQIQDIIDKLEADDE